MNSIYLNPDVATAMSGCGPVDRWIRGLNATLEHVVSVAVATGPDGKVGWVLSVDLILPDGSTVIHAPLGAYSWARAGDARSDAELVSRKLLLCLRLAEPMRGWVITHDPDGPAIVAPNGDTFKGR